MLQSLLSTLLIGQILAINSDNVNVSIPQKMCILLSEMKNWTEEFCQNTHTDLAFIYRLGDSQAKKKIGLFIKSQDKPWKGSNEKPFSWDSYLGNYLELYLNACVSQNTGTLKPEPGCLGKTPFMCEKVTWMSDILIKEYKFNSTPLNWSDAQRTCHQEGGELASKQNEKEQEVFKKIIWIGLDWKQSKGKWQWSNEEPFQDLLNCSEMDRNSQKDKNYPDGRAFICYHDTVDNQKNPSTPTTVTATTKRSTAYPTTENANSTSMHSPSSAKESPASVRDTVENQTIQTAPTTVVATIKVSTANPTTENVNSTSLQCLNSESFSNFPNTESITATSYLQYNEQNMTWIEALKYCKANKSHLVHITDDSTQTHVTKLLSNKTISKSGVWIGLERSVLLGNWPWFWTGGPAVTYHRWHSCFPLAPQSHHCGKLVQEHGQWLDACCQESLPFICQSEG